MRHSLVASLLVVLCSISVPAFADIITINSTLYPSGLPDHFEGLVMSRLQQPWVSSAPAVYAPRVGAGDFSMTNGWENYDDCYQRGQATPRFSCTMGFSLIELRFDAPVDFILLNSSYGSDAPRIWAYDVLGNMIGNIGAYDYNPTATGATSHLMVSHAERDIARIVVGGALGNARITEVRYNVTEPTTLGLMAVGLLGVVLMRIR